MFRLFSKSSEISTTQLAELLAEDRKHQASTICMSLNSTLSSFVKETKTQSEAMRQNTQQVIDAIIENSEHREQALIEKIMAMQTNSWQGYEEAHSNSLIRVEKFKNQELLAQQKKEQEEIEKQQLKAAYALNMCMVSLSQIVDYKDINILRQEYESILNNLNIGNIIKDEALLDALKKILDTCHFYLLHEKDKEMLKKKQAARLKGALGKALSGGNVIAIFSGNINPWAMVATAGILIGSAVVSYKSEKAKAQLENEEDEWALEKSALEQLHNLRRTLFETAWRLAKVYQFPDEYRLTEKQIHIYNETITDPDPLNRYERLYLLKDNFKAYPLFWYYLGRAALETADLYRMLRDDESEYRAYPRPANEIIYKSYRQKAKKAFDKFIEIHIPNQLLREDVIAASAYIDSSDFYFDDPIKMKECIDNAKKIAGLDLEIVQTCAFRYAQISEMLNCSGNFKEAKESSDSAIYCLRLLLNQEYYPELNGRALSRIYIENRNAEGYLILKDCVSTRTPFVYNHLLKWNDEEYQKDFYEYLNRGQLFNTIGKYLEGRIRCICSEFYNAAYIADVNVSMDSLECLTSWAEVARAEDIKNQILMINLKTSNSNFKKITELVKGAEIWQPTGDVKIKVSTDEPTINAMKKYYECIMELVENAKTYERKWYTLWTIRHDVNFSQSLFEIKINELEKLLEELVQKQAELFFQNFSAELRKMTTDEGQSFLLNLITFMTQECETMRENIQNITKGKFCYKDYHCDPALLKSPSVDF